MGRSGLIKAYMGSEFYNNSDIIVVIEERKTCVAKLKGAVTNCTLRIILSR